MIEVLRLFSACSYNVNCLNKEVLYAFLPILLILESKISDEFRKKCHLINVNIRKTILIPFDILY